MGVGEGNRTQNFRTHGLRSENNTLFSQSVFANVSYLSHLPSSFLSNSSCSILLLLLLLFVVVVVAFFLLTDIFPANLQICSLRYRLLCMVLIVLSSKEMIVGTRYVQLAAIWHCYLPLSFFLSLFSFFFSFFNVFLLLFLSPINLVLITDNLEWSTTQACPSLKCLFNKGNAEGTNISKMRLMILCLCIVLYYQS